jgi:hypothetical protein
MVDEPASIYHVLLEGRTVGPYDRRTIVGMRIKKTLARDQVLVNARGSRLTVAELIGKHPAATFNPNRSGSFSKVQATYPASLIETQGRGLAIPRFSGEVQARVQGEVLRITGRCRRALRWKDGRIKIVLGDVVHARVQSNRVDLWLRNGRDDRLQRIALDLFMPATAAELVARMPALTPLPEALAAEPTTVWRTPLPTGKVLAIAVVGVALVVGLMLILMRFLLSRRSF